MQLDLLREHLDAFVGALAGGYQTPLTHLYESIALWQNEWPPTGVSELAPTLERAIGNTQTRRLWQGHAYFPKEVLLELTRHSPEMINLALAQLFDEKAELGDRFSKFNFVLDQMLDDVRRTRPLKAPVTHYHDDYRAPSLYTTLRLPATHAYFEPGSYLAALGRLRAPDVGRVADAGRFAKSVRVINTFLAKDERMPHAHLGRLESTDYRGPAALLASEFFHFLSTEKGK